MSTQVLTCLQKIHEIGSQKRLIFRSRKLLTRNIDSKCFCESPALPLQVGTFPAEWSIIQRPYPVFSLLVKDCGDEHEVTVSTSPESVASL